MDEQKRRSAYELLSVREAARVLWCSESTVRRAVAERRIPWFRVRPRGMIKIPYYGLEELIRPGLLEAADEATRGTSEPAG